MFYVLRMAAAIGVFEASEGKSTIAHLTAESLRRYRFAFPPRREQECISSFLDREAAKIDTLIAEQQRLIELLTEKRHAVIARAVTKGLNPAAPMKDSGVEWLGEVPGHWRVVPVKYLAEVGNGSTPHRDRADYWTDGDYPWLSSTVVNGEVVLEAEEFVTELALTECHLPKVTPPAVLIGITGQGKTRGMAALLGIEATTNQHIAFVRPRDNCTSAEFLRRYFETAYQRMRFESDGVGSTKGAITCEQISNMRLPIPPPEEQNAIVVHLSHVTSELDRLALEATTAIELLRERRTALISAAVTGQIDVRDSASVESALAETRADIAAGRYVVESAATHVARVQAMAAADEHSPSPPHSC
jgi:type I restriction enzyme S subunit